MSLYPQSRRGRCADTDGELFADATEITAGRLRSAGRLPLRMLALGFPSTTAPVRSTRPCSRCASDARARVRRLQMLP